MTTASATEIEKLHDDKKVEIKDTIVLATYDLSVTENATAIKIEGTDKYTISLKVDKTLTKGFTNFKVVYTDENNNVKEVLDAKLVNGYIVFGTTHLSTYSVVGYNYSVTTYGMLALIAGAELAYTGKLLKRKYER